MNEAKPVGRPPSGHRPSRAALAWWLVATLWLCVSVGLYGRLAGLRGWSGATDVQAFLLHMGGLFLLYGPACVVVQGSSRIAGRRLRPSARTVLAVAAIFRLAVLPAGFAGQDPGLGVEALRADLRGEVSAETFLLYDNDVWRYLWDGHVGLMGFDVYALSPAQIEAGSSTQKLLHGEAWEEIHSRVSYPTYRTVYPPLAQGLFQAVGLVAPASAAAWKIPMLFFDLGTCALLLQMLRRAGKPVSWAVVYAWNPAVVKELVGSAHVDAALIFFLLAAVGAFLDRRPARGWLCWSAALLIKPTPILILPLLLRRSRPSSWWIPPVVGGLAFLPFASSIKIYFESLAVFVRDWAFNAGPWELFHVASKALGLERQGADAASLAMTCAVIAWVAWTDDGSPRALLRGLQWILGVYLVLSPTVMPWYLLWILPFVCFRPTLAWPVFTGAALLSYLIYVDGREPVLWRWVEYGLLGAALLWDRHRAVDSGPKLRTSAEP